MAKSAERTVVQLVYLDETGDTNYRMRWPAQELALLAPTWRVVNLDARSADRIKFAEEADLLVVFQSHDVDLLPMIARRRAAGKKTLVEYNDNFYEPPPSSPVSEAWQSPLIWNTYELFMREADGVITTCDELKTLFSSITEKPVFVLKNHLPKVPGNYLQKWDSVEQQINIGLAGSVGHMGDYLAILPELRELFAQDRRLKLLTMGNEALPSLIGLPQDRFNHTPWGAMEDYFKFLERVHIGLIPLLDTSYNRCRSDIKAVEIASRCGLPLVTDLPPYKDFLQATKVPAADSIVAVPETLAQLTANVSALKDTAEQAFNYVRHHRIGPNRLERLSLYESFMSNSTIGKRQEKPGYKEVIGKLIANNAEAGYIERAQAKARTNAREEALAIVEEGLASNIYSSSLTLMKLRLLASSTGRLDPRELNEARARFDRDIRFSLFELSISTSTEDRQEKMTTLFCLLDSSPTAATKFFQPQICQLLTIAVESDKSLIAHVLPFLKFYQHDAKLNYTLAEAAAASGMHDCAFALYDWLLQAREIAGVDNSKTLSNLDRNYLLTRRNCAEALVTSAAGKHEP